MSLRQYKLQQELKVLKNREAVKFRVVFKLRQVLRLLREQVDRKYNIERLSNAFCDSCLAKKVIDSLGWYSSMRVKKREAKGLAIVRYE